VCGPADFDALNTCVIRLAQLSAAGLTTYSVCKTASLYRQLRAKRGEREKKVARNIPGRVRTIVENGQ